MKSSYYEDIKTEISELENCPFDLEGSNRFNEEVEKFIIKLYNASEYKRRLNNNSSISKLDVQSAINFTNEKNTAEKSQIYDVLNLVIGTALGYSVSEIMQNPVANSFIAAGLCLIAFLSINWLEKKVKNLSRKT